MATVEIVATKQRKLTGYNLFLKDQMPTVKLQVKGRKERFTLIGANWTKLPQAVKDQWNLKALTLPQTESKKKGHVCGYNIFVREQTKGTKVTNGIKTKMSTVGAHWRALPIVEQEKYNAQAKMVSVA